MHDRRFGYDGRIHYRRVHNRRFGYDWRVHEGRFGCGRWWFGDVGWWFYDGRLWWGMGGWFDLGGVLGWEFGWEFWWFGGRSRVRTIWTCNRNEQSSQVEKED